MNETTGGPSNAATDNQQQAVHALLLQIHEDRSREARWRRATGWVKTMALVGFVASFAFLSINVAGAIKPAAPAKEHTALVRVDGQIAANSPANADQLVVAIREAMANERSRALIVRVNSPGGSPVHSGRIYQAIMTEREKYPDKPIYAVVDDMAASGGYYIAAAAERIYADQASLVGSIGVISPGFDLTGLMDKLGVKRRALHAGESKALMDPFLPMDKEDVDFWQTVLDTTHDQFIAAVKNGRGDRLANDERIFSGLLWSGEQAIELGLVDALGNASSVATDVVGVSELVDYTPREPVFGSLMSLVMSKAQTAISTTGPMTY